MSIESTSCSTNLAVSLSWFDPGTLSFEMAKGIPAAFVALLIGFAAAYIAWQQYQTARAKLKLDLFDRRYEIFELTWRHLSEPILEGAGEGELSEFTNCIPQASFLFDANIEAYLVEISKKRNELWEVMRNIKGTVMYDPQDIRQQAIERNIELMTWFEEQAHGAKDKFSPWLNFKHWK